MKELYSNLFKLILIWLLAIFIIASCGRSAYAVDLSKSIRVTPERHSGFFVPQICIGSQSMHIHGTSVSATQTRLYSLYEGMTRQNKSVMANMSGGSNMPRVNPLTIISQVVVNPQNSKILGGIAHA